MQVRSTMPRLGTRKLYHLLKPGLDRKNIKMGRDVFFSFLRAERLLIRPRKRYVRTTDSSHWMRKYPNLTQDLTITQPERLWVTDITYIKTTEGPLYLNMITDAYSRKIMGYSISTSMETAQIVKALKMAVGQRQYKHSLVHHSDRGLQYCSYEYIKVAREHKLCISMTEHGDPYENALAERMNRTIKEEFLLDDLQAGREDTIRIVNQAIKTYNTKRPHLALNYQTPDSVHNRKIPVTKRNGTSK